MAEIIDNMAEYSFVKKPGFFAKAKGVVAGVFTERTKDMSKVIDGIQLAATPASFPPEVQTALANIAKAKIWDKDFLAKLDPSVIKHIDSLAKSINGLIARESKLTGTRNALDTEYQSWVAAFSDMEKVVADFTRVAAKSEVIQQATVEQQRQDLGISDATNANADLISAFAYMGIELTPKADGTYDYVVIPDRGFPYQENGVTKYQQISIEAAKSFVENYLAKGELVGTAEEKALADAQRELEEANKALEEARAARAQAAQSEREGGFEAKFGPEMAEYDRAISRAERKVASCKSAVEKAEAAASAKRTQTITPKGLFKYFVEQELIGKTSRRKIDRQNLVVAQNTFNIEGAEWEAFQMSRNPQAFMDDLSFVGLTSLTARDVERQARTQVAQYDDYLESSTSDTFAIRRVVNKLERDANGIMAEVENSYDAIQEAREATIDKYQDVVRRLEEQVALYQKQGTPVPPNLQATLSDMRDRARTIESFESVMGDIRLAIIAGELTNIPDNIMGNNLELVNAVRNQLSFDGGQLTLKNDLVNAATGEVWLTKDQFEGLMRGESVFEQNRTTQPQTPQNPGAQPTNPAANAPDVLPDVLMSSMDFEMVVGPNSSFPVKDILEKDAMLSRAMDILADGKSAPNPLYNMYQDYVKAVNDAIDQQKTPPTPTEFITAALAAQQAKPDAEKQGNDLCGICPPDIMASAFHEMAQSDAAIKTSGLVGPSNSPEVINTFRIRSDAELAYFHLDLVSQAIAQDPALNQQYLAADETQQSAIFSQVYGQLKTDGKLIAPRPFQVEEARKRWASYYRFASDNQIVTGMIASPDFDTKNSNHVGLANAMARVLKKDELSFSRDVASLEAEGKPTVDYSITPVAETDNSAEAEAEAEKDDNLIEFKKLFPRGTPQFAIQKKLQPYNIKAGLKFLDQIMDAFKDVMVKNPWAKVPVTPVNDGMDDDGMDDDGTNPGGGGTNPPNPPKPPTPPNPGTTPGGNNGTGTGTTGGTQTTQNEANNRFLDGLDDNQVQNRLAMMAVTMGVNSILDQLNVEQDFDANNIRKMLDYMNVADVRYQPKVDLDGQQVLLADAMQRVFLEFATGTKEPNEARASMTAISQQFTDNEVLKNFGPMIESMNVLMGVLTPAEIIQMMNMTSENQMDGSTVTIEMGSKLTKEDIAMFRTLKTKDQIYEMIQQSEMYNQQTIQNIFEAGREAKQGTAEMEQ